MFEIVILSLAFYSTFYLLLRVLLPYLFPKLYESFDDYHLNFFPQTLVCFIHAASSGIFAIYLVSKLEFSFNSYTELLRRDREPFLPLEYYNLIQYSIGYFAHDIVLNFVFPEKLTALDYAHHFIAILAFTSALVTNLGVFIVVCLLTNEFSTPFMHIRSLFKIFHVTDGFLVNLNNYIFLSLFFVIRILYTGYVWFCVIYSVPLFAHKVQFSGFNIGFQVTCFTLHYLLQITWFVMILKYLLAKRSRTHSLISKKILKKVE